MNRSSQSYQRAEVLEMHKAVKAQRVKLGLPTYEFGLGSPEGVPSWFKNSQTFYPRFTELLQGVPSLGYRPQGWKPLREAYALMYRKMGIIAQPEQFSENDGSRGLIYRAAAALLAYQFAQCQEKFSDYPDHPVAIVPDPCYGPFLEAVEESGGEAILVPCDSDHNYFQGIEDVLKSGVKPTLVFANNFHNPSGVACEANELTRLVEQAHEIGFLILSDRTYSELAFPGIGTPQLSIFNIQGAWEVAYEIFTLSKTYGIASWRIGGGLGRPRFTRMIDKIKAKHGYGLSLLAEIGGYLAIMDHPNAAAEYASELGERAQLWASHLGCAVPPGGLFEWVDVSEMLRRLRLGDSAELCNYVMRTTGVEWWSGLCFATPKMGATKVRISLGQPLEVIEAACEQLIHAGITSRNDQGRLPFLVKA